ncbi:glycosyltransferase family 2 protein [Streptomyces jumonjinensis]|uniref:glycosyltransferase family 2 protein n=1 Tax=Streptomyces jumonjinensis TaxID=1945 RepID=UPI003795FB69
MNDLMFSIVIPYKQRLDNIRAVFTSLAEQTLDPAGFEIVVGAMEYDPAFVSLCREFTDRLRIVSVLTADEWNTSQARNLGIRHASGRVVVVLDADVALAPAALRNLWERHFQHGQNVCVLGQVFGYDEVLDDDVDDVEAQPYARYRGVFAELETADRARLDPRWSAEYASAFARFPWAFARTGLMALPTALIRRHGLLLDEGFRGWGAEDQEWGLRISRTGTPITLGQDVYGVHLPHRRDFASQDRSATLTNRYYLAKWPRLELELALAFGGWLAADRLFPEAERELAGAGAGRRLGTVRGTVGGARVLAVGALLDVPPESGGPAARPPRIDVSAVDDPEIEAVFGGLAGGRAEVLPLAGFALPYEDDSVDECRVLAPVQRLSERYRDAILREAERVSLKPVAPVGDSSPG